MQNYAEVQNSGVKVKGGVLQTVTVYIGIYQYIQVPLVLQAIQANLIQGRHSGFFILTGGYDAVCMEVNVCLFQHQPETYAEVRNSSVKVKGGV